MCYLGFIQLTLLVTMSQEAWFFLIYIISSTSCHLAKIWNRQRLHLRELPNSQQNWFWNRRCSIIFSGIYLHGQTQKKVLITYLKEHTIQAITQIDAIAYPFF